MSKGVLTPDNEDFGFTKVCISKRRTELAYDLWCDSLGTERDKAIHPFIMLCRVVDDNEELPHYYIRLCLKFRFGNISELPEFPFGGQYVRL